MGTGQWPVQGAGELVGLGKWSGGEFAVHREVRVAVPVGIGISLL